MSTLDNSINVAVAGSGLTFGTGTKGTKRFFKEAREFWLTPQGYIFDGTEDFTDTYVSQLIADEKIIVLENVNAIDPDNVENSYEDIGRGVTSLENKGLYGLIMKFRSGEYFEKVLNSLSGTSRWDLLAIDGNGTLMGTFAADGTSLKGFTLGEHQLELSEGKFDKNSTLQKFKVQFLETDEFADPAFKYADDDFNGRNASAVNDIKLTLTTPSDTDTTVTVKAVYRQDGSVFTGAVFGQFLVTKNGVTANPSGGDDSVTAGTYVLTGITAIATNDVVTVRLYDNSNNRPGITVGGYAFKSQVASKTAVA
ncbi:hypothetical protein [Tenacibaculum sp.]|uniref:hypothetical protein n=1 Tax=Tenacibaculum sp. TaxID=1906242 RepID=UPI003D0D7972